MRTPFLGVNMKTVPIAEIQINARQRKSYDEKKLANLIDSISRLGLLHAPILQEGVLVCGGRRLKAISMLDTFGNSLRYQGEEIPTGYVPFTELGTSSVEQIMEAELEENLMRENLSVQEEAAALADLHALRVKQNPEHTKIDTAREVHKPGTKLTEMDVRDAILINEHSDIPEVAKAKTKKEAMKVITQKKRTEHNEKLATLFKQEFGASGSPHKLLKGDTFELMKELPDKSFDVILTDPPYGIDAQKFNAQEGIKHEYNDTRFNFELIIDAIAVQGYRVCKSAAHAYIFHDHANWEFIRQRMEGAGWDVWPRPLIWAKGNGLLARPDHGPRYTYECILYASKGARQVTHVAPDVITFRTLTRQRRGAEKPAALYCDLLARSVRPGDTVLDACCGTGPIFPAANELNCKAVGIDCDSAAIGYASTRLNLNLKDDEDRREKEDG
jgi:site-specific DNA-methyltransferase (adenine-specific)